MSAPRPLAPFTAGPLRVTREVDLEGYCQHSVRAPNGIALAVLSNYNGGEQLANATLYATAPELLDALTFAVRFWDQLTPADAERMRAVLVKATGGAS
jgi:hypothetical protein